MGDSPSSREILTLEPLLEAVREGLERAGWQLSGLQKTTSYEFEGRWAGDSSRSAYLFFHRPGVPDEVSIDVFLDETTRGLKGNLALVVDGPILEELPRTESVLASLSETMNKHLPTGYRTPLTLRYRLPGPGQKPGLAESEVRFKLYLPRAAIAAGASAVSALAASIAEAYREILRGPDLEAFLAGEE